MTRTAYAPPLNRRCRYAAVAAGPESQNGSVPRLVKALV